MPSEPDVVAWVLEHAVQLDPDTVAATDVDLLSGLDGLVEGKGLAFVGESNHFVHEKYAYRTLLARYLISRGFSVIGEELSWSDGLRIDRYIQTGEESWLDRVTAYGYTGDHRDDRDDTPTGILGEGWKDPDPAFRAEQVRFAHELRGLHVRFFGFDVDYHPSSGYSHVHEWFDRCGASSDRARAAFARVSGESMSHEAERLTDACDLLDRSRSELEAEIGTDGYAELVRSAATLRDSHRYAAAAYPATSYEALGPPMALREKVMHSHVDHVIEREGPQARIALFSHNLHLARDDAGVSSLTPGVGPGGGTTDPLGTHLSSRRPNGIVAVWMLEYEGRHSSPMASLGRTVEPVAGTLNAALAEAGDCFVVPTSSVERNRSPFEDAWDVVMMHGSRTNMRVAEQADAVFFQRHVSPLRL